MKIDLTVQPGANSQDATAANGTLPQAQPMPASDKIDTIFTDLANGAAIAASEDQLPGATGSTAGSGSGGTTSSSNGSTATTGSSGSITGQGTNAASGSEPMITLPGSTPSSSTASTSTGKAPDPGSSSSNPAGNSATAGGSSAASAPGNSGGTPNNLLSQPSSSELNACARLQGVSVSFIKVVTDQAGAAIVDGGVVAIKLAGHNARLTLNLGDSDTLHLAGLCLFVTGDQGEADVQVGMALDRLIYIGQGNQSLANIDFSGHGTLAKLAASLAGNEAALHLTGLGTRTGDTVQLSGHDPLFTCQ